MASQDRLFRKLTSFFKKLFWNQCSLLKQLALLLLFLLLLPIIFKLFQEMRVDKRQILWLRDQFTNSSDIYFNFFAIPSWKWAICLILNLGFFIKFMFGFEWKRNQKWKPRREEKNKLQKDKNMQGKMERKRTKWREKKKNYLERIIEVERKVGNNRGEGKERLKKVKKK